MHTGRAHDAGAGTGFIDPRVLAKIDNLELLARTVVEGFINGLHRSPNLGASMDFAEHRAYMPGDDLRRIDWRLFGRSDRYFVKEFEADTNTNLLLLLDVSGSMEFGESYSRTLREWYRTFNEHWDEVARLGFDDRFRRMWNMYLTCCAACFHAGTTDVSQITLRRPA